MTYERFEELPVWRDAIELVKNSYHLIDNERLFRSRSGLKSQLERAAVSISNNIAEGFERGTTQELITFLYIARGSAGEVRSMFCLLEQLPEFSNLKSQISNLKSSLESISRQLRAWTENLQNSQIKGQRYLNDKIKERERRRKEYQEAWEEIKRLSGIQSEI